MGIRKCSQRQEHRGGYGTAGRPARMRHENTKKQETVRKSNTVGRGCRNTKRIRESIFRPFQRRRAWDIGWSISSPSFAGLADLAVWLAGWLSGGLKE